ncbi:MAG: hypothetical protein IJ071_04525 [Ruminococcus sp.]|nr:hypothetical protein [Ruminococcus sp.]
MNKKKKELRIMVAALAFIMVIGVIFSALSYGALFFGEKAEGTVINRKRVRKSSQISITVEYDTPKGPQESFLRFTKKKAPQVGDKIELCYLPAFPGRAYSKDGAGLVLMPVLLIAFPAVWLYLLLRRERPSQEMYE